MDKNKKYVISVIISFLILIGSISFLIIYTSNPLSYYCLKQYAENQCKNQNTTLYDFGDNMRGYMIRCDNPKYEQRNYESDELIVFRFLEEELDNCRISFKEKIIENLFEKGNGKSG